MIARRSRHVQRRVGALEPDAWQGTRRVRVTRPQLRLEDTLLHEDALERLELFHQQLRLVGFRVGAFDEGSSGLPVEGVRLRGLFHMKRV